MRQLAMTNEASDAGTTVVALYEEHRDAVYRYLLNFGLDPGQAVEQVQEAFLRLFQELSRGRQIANPRAWVYSVAHNAAINARYTSLRNRDLSDDVIATLADSMPTPEQALIRAERLFRIKDELGKLNARQQHCLRLRAEGFSYREIAEITSSKLSAVAKIVQRAITQIRKVIYD